MKSLQQMRRVLLRGSWILIIVCLLIFVYWKTNGQELTEAFNERMLNRAGRFLNGRLSAEQVELSLFKSTVIHKLVVYDKNNKPVAASEKVTVDLDLMDILHGDFELDKIRSVSVAGLQLHLERDPKGRWNVEDILLPRTDERKFSFRGQVLFEQATVTLLISDQKKTFEKIAGILDFSSFPEIKAEIDGTLGGSTLSVRGQWSESETMDLRIHVDEMDAALLPANMTTIGKVSVLGGKVSDATISLAREKGERKISVSSGVSNFSIGLSGEKVADVQGRVRYADQWLLLDEITMGYAGQSLSVSGGIDLSTAQPGLKLTVSSSSFDLSSLSKSSPVKGKLSFNAVVEGSPEILAVKGNFQMPAGSVDSVEFKAAAGNFEYQADELNIQQTVLSSLGGVLTVSGKWNFKTGDFEQKIHGSNIDAARLSGSSVQGSVEVEADIFGKSGQDLVVNGSFSIPAAVLHGSKFTEVSGEFVKDGEILGFSNLSLTTGDQKFSADGKLTFGTDGPVMDFSLRSDGIELTAFRPDMPVSGQMSFQAEIMGPLKKYQITGTFDFPAGKVGTLSFSSGSGGFSLENDLLTLKDVSANVLGGSIATDGIIAKDGTYTQRISGKNLDAALLSDGEVTGKASFYALVTGKGPLESASVEGEISMDSGTISTHDFTALNILFSKQGKQIKIPEINIKFLRGFVKGTGHSEGDYLIIKMMPSGGIKTDLLGLGSRLAVGMNPVTAVVHQAVFKKIPLGVMRIRLKSLGEDK